ncbi:MAG: aldose 1-epimerase family protein [Sarcina sp.]
MSYILENEFLSITAANYGAELHSIKEKGENIEYLWNGNPDFWKYHAPILFPIIGKVKNNSYKVNGEIFNLPQHGLGRLQEFKVVNKTENSLTFNLDYSDETLKIYPFKFSLFVIYELIDKTIKITYKVKNLDDKEIYFSIGAHPAYMCPILENETINDYYFEFNKKETADIMLLNTSTGLFTGKTQEILNKENKIQLSKELFKNDALVFKSSELESNIINLKSKKHNKSIEFDFSNFPYLGLWAPATGAPFICIEPWFGHADYENFDGEFKDKEGVLSLPINDEFQCSYSVTIHN